MSASGMYIAPCKVVTSSAAVISNSVGGVSRMNLCARSLESTISLKLKIGVATLQDSSVGA